MNKITYSPLTACEVAWVLAIADCDELAGERIAGDMLSGLVEFTEDELERLAAYKGVDFNELTTLDPRFRRYAKVERLIAERLISRGFNAEFAAEICEVDVAGIRKTAIDADR